MLPFLKLLFLIIGKGKAIIDENSLEIKPNFQLSHLSGKVSHCEKELRTGNGVKNIRWPQYPISFVKLFIRQTENIKRNI